jgi:hypothetical protein
LSCSKSKEYLIIHSVIARIMQEYFQLAQRPLYQAIFFLILTIVLYAIVRPGEAEKVWVIAGILYITFILTNSILFWPAGTAWSYFFYSLLFSIIYLVVIGGVVKVYSDLFKVEGSGESGMIFLVIIYHPFALLLVMLLKWLFAKFFL